MTHHNFCAVNRARGARNRRKRERLKQQQNNRCHWCGIEMTEVWQAGCGRPKKTAITVDHILPLGEGGTNHDFNCVASCHWCNNNRNTVAARRNKALHEERKARLRAMEIELNGGLENGEG